MNRIARLLRRYHLPLMLLLGVFSPLVVLLSRPFPQSVWHLLMFSAGAFLLAGLLVCVPGRVRMPLFAAGCALGVFAGYRFFPDPPAFLCMSVVGSLALFVSLSFADQSPEEASPVFYVSTLVSQLGALFLLHSAADQKAAYPMLCPLLQAGFVLYLLLLLLAFSRISLNNATLSRYRLPVAISRVCTMLTVCFLALALALSSLPALISCVYAAFHLLRRAAAAFLLFLANLLPMESAGGFQGGVMPMLPALPVAADQEPPLFFILLEKAAEILTIIVLIAGSLLLVRLLSHLLLRFTRHLLRQLQHYAKAASQDYEDEITDTRQEDADRSVNLLTRRFKRRGHAYPDTPAGEIRRGYARLLRAHGEWKTGSTARENLPAGAASLYEHARYSQHPVTQEDADRFSKETRHL